MSEHEFEQFLALFRGMLRLNPAQRDEIAAELMDHLQERLAELSNRGMPRDKAVQLALEEFGDAAGLAAQFALILSQQRRRRIMKWTASSVVAVTLMLFGAYAFWPATPVRGPVVTQVVAQDRTTPAEKKKERKEKTAAATAAKTDPTQELESRLAEKTSASFVEVSLQDFLTAIGEKAKVDFYIDKSSLDAEGVATDTGVTVNLKSIRHDRLLDLVLDQLELGWVVKDGYVLVTTRTKLDETLETRVYNCRDLVEMTLGAAAGMSGFGSSGYEGMGGGETAMPGASGGMPGMGMPGMAGMPGMQGMQGMSMGGEGGMGSTGMGGMGGGMMSGGMGGGMGMGMGMGMGSTGFSSEVHMQTLIRVITTTVMPESWTEPGGSGSVAAYHGGLLVVNHHTKAHQKIEQLLRMLREASKDRPGAIVRER